MPGIREERYGIGDMSWLGSTHGIYNCRTSTLDMSAFTEATHYPDGYIPSGTPVNAADEGAVVPFDGAAVGAQLGFLYGDQRVVGDDTQPAPVLRHGVINVGNLPGADFTVPTAGAGSFVFVGSGA